MEVAQVHLGSHDVRRLDVGDEPFKDLDLVVRLFSVEPDSSRSDTYSERFESSIKFSTNTLETDSEAEVDLEVRAASTQQGGVIQLTIPPDCPEDIADWLKNRVVGEMVELEVDSYQRSLRNLADILEFFPLHVLRERIDLVEKSVRRALDDDHISESDYKDLRAYPDRLALVRKLARILRTFPPDVQERESPTPSILAPPVIDTNPFWKAADQVASDAGESMSQLSILISSQQVVLNERQAQVTERFQRLLTLIGSIILVPGLIAGIFGANVAYRGSGTPGGFWAMLLFMIGGSIASYAIIRAIEEGLWADSGVWTRSKIGATGVLMFAVAVASILCLAAISILVF